MEKINKEELMKKLNLTEEEMEKVAGAGQNTLGAEQNTCTGPFLNDYEKCVNRDPQMEHLCYDVYCTGCYQKLPEPKRMTCASCPAATHSVNGYYCPIYNQTFW